MAASLIELLLFILPSYVSNAIPVVLGGGPPLDLRMKWRGQRLLGGSKTIRGFLAGVSSGTVAGGLLSLLYPLPFFSSAAGQFAASFLLALGAMAGDALGSLIKRRLGMDPGKPFVLDSILFLLVALLLAYPFTSAEIYTPLPMLFLVAITLVLHPLTNMIANKLGMKAVPW